MHVCGAGGRLEQDVAALELRCHRHLDKHRPCCVTEGAAHDAAEWAPVQQLHPAAPATRRAFASAAGSPNANSSGCIGRAARIYPTNMKMNNEMYLNVEQSSENQLK